MGEGGDTESFVRRMPRRRQPSTKPSEEAAMEDKAKGRIKEAYGAITGDEEKKAEGRVQQRKGAASEEATQRAKTRQAEKEAKEAERERDRQRRKQKGGLLGDVGDTLSGH
jgi:uncharacterized protein YjbJ (UPF0337 family)